ncbi:hypothetical protein B1F75_12765 [Pseudomonas syringae]|nr:hypothetical protein B1F71_12810 [Pseudomonas syringae]RXT93777.1 hypothetical protein B1F75_12765 [Pseudomonas syringae]
MGFRSFDPEDCGVVIGGHVDKLSDVRQVTGESAVYGQHGTGEQPVIHQAGGGRSRSEFIKIFMLGPDP